MIIGKNLTRYSLNDSDCRDDSDQIQTEITVTIWKILTSYKLNNNDYREDSDQIQTEYQLY